MSKAIFPNSTLAHYTIISQIGAGGMGEVYLAKDTKLDRKVAIKLLHDELSKDSDKLNRFVKEAKAASALNHSNILTVYEIGDADGKDYIVTELIEGKTLRSDPRFAALVQKVVQDRLKEQTHPQITQIAQISLRER